MKKIAIVCLSEKGYKIAQDISNGLNDHFIDIYVPEKLGLDNHPPLIPLPSREGKVLLYHYPLNNLIKNIFNKYDTLVFVMALGIIIRSIAPLLQNKSKDPAIITIDEAANFCISTLGGHEAGANKLTKLIANITGAKEVITTASEGSKIVLGIGLKKNKTVKEIKTVITQALQKKNIDQAQIKEILTIDIKKEDQALIDACSDLNIPLQFVSKEQINALETEFGTSEFVIASVGAKAVCEPAALIGSDNKQLIMKKTAFDGITIAIAR